MVKSGGIYSVRNAFATRLQQKYLKNVGHFSVIDTGECPFYYADVVSVVMLSSFSKVLLITSTRSLFVLFNSVSGISGGQLR